MAYQPQNIEAQEDVCTQRDRISGHSEASRIISGNDITALIELFISADYNQRLVDQGGNDVHERTDAFSKSRNFEEKILSSQIENNSFIIIALSIAIDTTN